MCEFYQDFNCLLYVTYMRYERRMKFIVSLIDVHEVFDFLVRSCFVR